MRSEYETLIRQSACTVVDRLRAGDITPFDALDALEARIAQVEPRVNALPTLCFDRARAHAATLMTKPPAERGLLAGLPVAIKDLIEVSGVRTTHGSPAFADMICEQSDLLVENLESRGGVVYAKSNTPEFGASGHTDNDVFGPTRNPWDLSRSVAGSSGGAAAALACGSAWLAHGSDSAGSLRNPSSFCGTVGMRPSLGRVAHTPRTKVDANFVAHGPMARNVDDLALLLDAMCGEHPQDPRSMPAPATPFLAAARAGWTPKRVAYSPNLGITPVDPEVAEITRAAAHRFELAGTIVEEAHPDLSSAHECYRTLSSVDFATRVGWMLRDKTYRKRLSPATIRRIEYVVGFSAEDLLRAEEQRVVMMRHMLDFFRTYDLLLTPATIVAPFPIEDRGVRECAGTSFRYHFDWLSIAYAITLVCSPALSLPCGFTRAGLPVGLQLVAPPRCEARLLGGARTLEEILGVNRMTPIEPRTRASARGTDAIIH